MTKLDFATHLFRTARELSATQRVSIVTMLAMCEMVRHPDAWLTSGELACAVGIEANHLPSSMGAAVDEGWIERRQKGGPKSLIEWRITRAGQRIVALLLKSPEPQTATSR